MQDMVNAAANDLRTAADRLCSNFEQHRQVRQRAQQQPPVRLRPSRHGIIAISLFRICCHLLEHICLHQAVSRAAQQLAVVSPALAPLCQAAQQVQLAGDFDANLKFAQLQRDSQRLHTEIQRSMLDSRCKFSLDSVFALQVSLPLLNVQSQSAILDSEMVAKLAPFLKGLSLKVGMTR